MARHIDEPKGDVLRLSRALQSGTGHVAVISDDPAAARAHARGALVRVEAAAVLHVTAAGIEPADAPGSGADADASRARVRSLMAPLLEQARAVEKPAFIVVDDADSAGGAALERIRNAVECAPDAIKWLRIVLVGGDELERALDDPAASALASRLCARVRMASDPATPLWHQSRQPAPLGIIAVTAFAITFLALGAWSSLLRTSAPPAQPITVARAEHQEPRPEPSPPQPVQAEPARAPTREAAQIAEAPVSPPTPEAAPQIAPVEPPLPETAKTPVTAADDEARADAAEQAPLAATAHALKASAVELDTPPAPIVANEPPAAAKSIAADATAGAKVEATTDTHAGANAPAAVASAPAAEAKPAVAAARAERPKPTAAVQSQKTAKSRTPPPASAPPQAAPVVAKADLPAVSRDVVLQVGSFTDAEEAYALRDELGAKLDHVLVARQDDTGPGPLYSVRVVGLGSPWQVAHAQAEIHALGHESVRYSKPGPVQRLGRSLASLFGR
jgi:hypothetical protein